MSYRVVSLLTDFGSDDPFVGIMKGVILGIAPAVQVVDLTHAVPAQDIRTGALLLRSAVGYFPEHTIHVAVVDPSVGSARRALVIETAHGLLVGPDNGLLAPAAILLGQESVRAIENPAFLRHPVSQTFHGRDVFAPAAAHLARGAALTEIGPVVESIVDIDLPQARATASSIDGEVLYVDRFGNLVTNISAAMIDRFQGRILSVSIATMQISGLAKSYADVAPGMGLAIVGSSDLLEIAVRNGSAARQLAVGAGAVVRVWVGGR
ncbi:MAG: SAM-dependent chlorinase/fluorinase [Deltaproteobacteria bacterium]|nr:SAM-dependent chlorinase/fluorinase [Deltaproteobacteria bacterium]